jgi:hypothetical protein
VYPFDDLTAGDLLLDGQVLGRTGIPTAKPPIIFTSIKSQVESAGQSQHPLNTIQVEPPDGRVKDSETTETTHWTIVTFFLGA